MSRIVIGAVQELVQCLPVDSSTGIIISVAVESSEELMTVAEWLEILKK
jgi:hypothetical protein